MRYNLHSKSIDALRGIAAAAVFFSHSDAAGLATNAWLSTYKGMIGDFGVYIFFCLSGYLIWRSGNKLVGTPQGLTRYAIHRFTRLVPLYVVNILVVTSLVGLIGSRWAPTFDMWSIIRHLTFTQDLYPSVSRSINPILWTLTHEVMFYAVVPLLIMCGIQSRTKILVTSLLMYAFFIASGLLEFFRFAQIFYAFAFGIFIAGASRKEEIIICLAAAIFGLIALYSERPLYAYTGRIAGVAFAMIIICATKGLQCGPWISRLMSPLVFLGVISYSLYIWHYQIIFIVDYHYSFFNNIVPGFAQYGMVSAVTLAAVCITFSYLSYVLIERPSMGTLRTWMERRIISSPATA
jgi:peptidoglycan/LPS O-acetylase OafA/YrhL